MEALKEMWLPGGAEADGAGEDEPWLCSLAWGPLCEQAAVSGGVLL